MPFEKGRKKTGGKKKGQQNRATTDFKDAVNRLLDYATPHMVEWLGLVAQEDPAKALDHVHKFAEYAHPKLARTEHTGKDGKDLYASMSPEEIDRQLNEKLSRLKVLHDPRQ